MAFINPGLTLSECSNEPRLLKLQRSKIQILTVGEIQKT